MTTTAVGSTSSSSSTSTSPASGLKLNASDFVTMMLKQLQNQDPLNPSNSDQLMSQMSAIGQMESSTQLQTTLTGLATQTQIGAASSLIGKQVAGIDATNNTITGTVSSVQVAGGVVNLQLDSGASLPLTGITTISPAATATTTAKAT